MWPDFSDPVVIAGAFCFIGYLFGFLGAVSLFWRRICRRADGTVRLLRMQIDDDTARLARQQDIIDELTVEVGQLYQKLDRLARRFAQACVEGMPEPMTEAKLDAHMARQAIAERVT